MFEPTHPDERSPMRRDDVCACCDVAFGHTLTCASRDLEEGEIEALTQCAAEEPQTPGSRRFSPRTRQAYVVRPAKVRELNKGSASGVAA